MEDRDFIDFKFGDHWASDFNLLAVSSGDRYSPPVYGSVNPNTATIAGKVGVYKWKTQVNEKVFNIKIAFDNINGQILNQIKEWLNPFKIDKLVFKEEPYKYYWVALNTEPKLDFLPFLEETKIVNGIAFKEGVYKGEFELQFVCFDNYGYSDWQSFDENYDYVVKEIEGEESISFNDGSDNNLIITKIEGNSKQRTREEVTGTVINGSEMTINEEYISNKTQFVIDGQSEQKVMNQLVKKIKLSPSGSIGSITYNENTGENICIALKSDARFSYLNDTIVNHKYYVSCEVNSNVDGIFIMESSRGWARVQKNIISNTNTKVDGIWSLNSDEDDYRRTPALFIDTVTFPYTMTVKNLMVIDLTSMYGAGNEPSIEQFKKDYPNEYYEFTNGLSPNPDYPQDIEVIDGVNLFDGELEKGWISTDGNLSSHPTRTRFADYKKVKGGEGYFLSSLGIISTENWWIYYYDENKQFISFTSATQMTASNNIFITPSKCAYIKGCIAVQSTTISEIMLVKGTTPKPYLPYGCIGLEQSGKNKADINSYYYDTVNYSDLNVSLNNGEFTISTDGAKIVTEYIKIPIKINSNGTYMFGIDLKTNKAGDTAHALAYDYTNKKIIGTIFTNTDTNYITKTQQITIDDSIDKDNILIFLYCPNNGTVGQAYYFSYRNIFFNEGTDTDYEPYHESKLIPINLNGNSLVKVGDIKDLLKVYRNGDVEISKDIGKVVLDGLSWTPSENFYFTKNINNIKYTKTNTEIGNGIAEKYKIRIGSGMSALSSVNHIAIDVSQVSVNTLETKPSGMFYYELATPETIKLPSIEPITLWQGTNKFKLITNLDTTMELIYNYLPAVPSIEEPSEIKNCKDSINIKVCNKNLYDKNNPNVLDTPIDSNGLGMNVKNIYKTIYVECKSNTTYTISKKYDTTKNRFAVAYTEEVPTYSMQVLGYTPNGTKSELTITTGENAKYLLAYVWIEGGTTTYQEMLDSIQIEEGLTATDYEEHKEQTVTFPLAEGQVLHEDDYLADDGIHQIKNTIIFDGTENWTYDKGTDKNNINNYSSVLHFTDRNEDNNYSKLFCSHFQNKGVWEKVDVTGVDMTKYYIYVSFPKTLASTQEEWKNWLAEQYEKGTPVKIEYYTREKIVIPYTTEQQIVYDEIKNNLYSYEGTNHIFSTDEVPPLLSISYVPKQDIYIDYVANQSNLLNDSAFYYNNDIYKKSYFDAETGDATKSGISEDRPVYLYNAGTTAANLNLTFDMIIPAEGSPLVINTESCKLTDNGIQVLKQVSSISISDFSKYKPFLEIYDGTPSNWQIQIDSNLCEIYLKHKTDKTKIISLNKFNDNQSFLSLANCNFVDYSKPFPTLITAISGTALENTVFNKLSVGTSAQNYRLKNVNVEWKHTYL